METGVQKRNIVLTFVCLAVLGFIICIASLGSISAGPVDPNFYYYSSGRKNALTLSTEKIAVRFKQGLTIEEQEAFVESEPGLGLFPQREEPPIFRMFVLPLLEGATEEYVIQTIKGLNSRAEVEVAYPIFDYPSSEIVLTDQFIVKFYPSVSEAEIDAFNTLNGVEIVGKIEGIEHYILRVTDPKNINTLKIANLYYENPITIFSSPNFIRRTENLPSSVTPDKKSGVVYINSETKLIEVYYPYEGVIRNIQGQTIYSLPSIRINNDYETYYVFDTLAGQVVEKQRAVYDKYRIKEGIEFDSSSGQFIDNTTKEIIPKEGAIELYR